jgi:hypothetical protein
LVLAALPPLELRGQHCQPNTRLESNSGKIMPRPAAINDKRHDPSQSSRAPSCSNNREGRYGLSQQASNPQAQKKSAVGGTKLGDTKRSIRLEAKNTAHGTWKQQAEAAEYRGHNGSTVWQQHHSWHKPFSALTGCRKTIRG